MKGLTLSCIALLVVSCVKSSHDPEGTDLTIDSFAIKQHMNEQAVREPSPKISALVLPAFDEIANEGITPNIQKYVEEVISKDTTLTLLKFPYRELMNVPYQNVFDREYCKPIVEKVATDIIIMTKVDLKNRTGKLSNAQWSLAFRLYYPKSHHQVDSQITGDQLSDQQIKEFLEAHGQQLINEIKSNGVF